MKNRFKFSKGGKVAFKNADIKIPFFYYGGFYLIHTGTLRYVIGWEEGLIEDEATYLIGRRYLQNLIQNNIDTLILGCTHYPLLKSVLQRITNKNVCLIDSGVEAARKVKEVLEKENKNSPAAQTPKHQFYLSDLPYKFQEIGERFLERTLPHVETVNFEKFLLDKGSKFWKKFDPIT